MAKVGLLDRLAAGPVICAEGYLFELERRGYVSAGAFVPVVVLDHPEAVAQLHREFLRAGSDIIEAFTYYAHREKMKLVGREESIEELNRQALKIATEVAAEGDALVAGNISNTNVWEAKTSDKVQSDVRAMFEEQVGWAVDANVDLVIGETFSYYAEAALALEVMKQSNLPTVVTLGVHKSGLTSEGMKPGEALARLEDAGADVVGLNCQRGLWTTLSLIEEVRSSVKGHFAALPVPYRTTPEQPTFQSLRDPQCSCIPDDRPFPTALDPFTCNRYEVAEFTTKARELGVDYLGLCCGNAPHLTRSMAESLGRRPPASEFSPDMSKHAFFGRVGEHNKKMSETL